MFLKNKQFTYCIYSNDVVRIIVYHTYANHFIIHTRDGDDYITRKKKKEKNEEGKECEKKG